MTPCSVATLALVVATAAAAEPIDPLYRDAKQPIDVRVADLLGRMTLQEKVNQTLNDFYAEHGLPSDSERTGQLAVASEGMRYLFKICVGQTTPAACIDRINHWQTVAKVRILYISTPPPWSSFQPTSL